LLERLEASVSERLKKAYAPKSQGPLGSALAALARFSDACPDRELFLRPSYAGDLAASAYNEWTLILLAEFLITVDSPTTGKPVAIDTAKTYISLLKGYLEFSYSFQLVNDPKRLGRLLTSIAEAEPLARSRKKRRGFRRAHLRRIWRRAWVRATDVDAVNRIACVGTAWHVLARGGELAPGIKAAGWRSDIHPTRADLTFGVRANGDRYAVLWLRPAQKEGQEAAGQGAAVHRRV
jgi:hypothetical protein